MNRSHVNSFLRNVADHSALSIIGLFPHYFLLLLVTAKIWVTSPSGRIALMNPRCQFPIGLNFWTLTGLDQWPLNKCCHILRLCFYVTFQFAGYYTRQIFKKPHYLSRLHLSANRHQFFSIRPLSPMSNCRESHLFQNMFSHPVFSQLHGRPISVRNFKGFGSPSGTSSACLSWLRLLLGLRPPASCTWILRRAAYAALRTCLGYRAEGSCATFCQRHLVLFPPNGSAFNVDRRALATREFSSRQYWNRRCTPSRGDPSTSRMRH